MGFVQAHLGNLTKFNSANSSKLIQLYEESVDEQIVENSVRPSHQTFAPSSIRCPRISWFRLRGVQPDKVFKPDRILDFSAKIGTACHEIIQNSLSKKLGDDWVDVSDYLTELNPPYEYDLQKDGFEYRVSIKDPPVTFAVDGILKLDNVPHLFEIKSSEYKSWSDLDNPKPHHVDQITCYAALLNIEHVLMMYIDRLYGEVKCFEVTITEDQRNKVWNMFKYVQDMVDANLAPDKLPSGDGWCSPSMCRYYEKCKSW